MVTAALGGSYQKAAEGGGLHKSWQRKLENPAFGGVLGVDKTQNYAKIVKVKSVDGAKFVSRSRARGDGGSPRQSGQTGHSGADPDEGYGSSPLQDELRCPCRDNQGGTASVSLPLNPVRDFLFAEALWKNDCFDRKRCTFSRTA